MAIRAASIWRAVIHPGSWAWMPKSPNVISLAPLAIPVLRPRCCLRCLTRRGINMSLVPRSEVRGLVVLAGAALDLLLLGEHALALGVGLGDERGGGDRALFADRLFGHGFVRCGHNDSGATRLLLAREAAAATRGDDAAGPSGATRGLTDGHGGLAGDLVLGGGLVGQDVALVDPRLHADAAEGRAGFPEAVVDVGAEGVQGNPTLAVPLAAGHFRAAEAARALDPDALGPGLLGRLHRPFHGPAEADPAGQLVGHALGDQGGVQLGLLDLLDVQLDLRVAAHLGQVGPEPVGLGAPAADDDARPGGVDVHPQAVTGALHLHAAD